MVDGCWADRDLGAEIDQLRWELTWVKRLLACLGSQLVIGLPVGDPASAEQGPDRR